MRGFLFLCGLALIIWVASAKHPVAMLRAPGYISDPSSYTANVYKFAFDSSADSFLRKETEEAIHDWENKAPGLTFQVLDSPCHEKNCIVIVSVTADSLSQEHGAAPGTDRYIGWCEVTELPIRIEIASDGLNQDYTIRHELGHAIGLGHGDVDTVMSWHSTQGATKVTCADVRAYFAM